MGNVSISQQAGSYFFDDFNRSDGAIGNNWTVSNSELVGSGYTPLEIRSNKINTATPGGLHWAKSIILRTLERYNRYPCKLSFTLTLDAVSAGQLMIVYFTHNLLTDGSGGTSLNLSFSDSPGISVTGAPLTTWKYSQVAGVTTNYEVEFYRTWSRVRYWRPADPKPSAWDLTSAPYAPAATSSTGIFRVYSEILSNSPAFGWTVDNIKIEQLS